MFWKHEQVDRHQHWLGNLEDYTKRVLSDKISRLDDKLDLILKELGKEYVPAKDTTEPANLVDVYTFDIAAARMAMCDGPGSATEDILKFLEGKTNEKIKKRGRPKK
jgi:hypothetical protein